MKISLRLLVLLSLSFTKAKDCDVFSSNFRSKTIADQCVYIYKAVREAFWSNAVNNYTLDEAFKTSSHHHPPTAIIIHYEVQIYYMNMSQSGSTKIFDKSAGYSGNLAASDIKDPDGNDHVACEPKDLRCTIPISLGWSSASIYTFIRPDFILSLQPGWFLCSLMFSVHEHFGFLREITFYIRLQFPARITVTINELKHSLEQITAKIKANEVSSTYVWTILSKTDGPTTFIEVIFTGMVLVVPIIILLLIYILPPYTKLRLDNLHERCPSVWTGLALLWLANIGLEIYHLVEIKDHDQGLYRNMRIAMLVAQPILDALCMVIVFIYKLKREQKAPFYYAVIITFGWALLRQLVSLFFFTAVYPVEIISTVGIVAFGIIIAFMCAYFSKRCCEAGQSDNDENDNAKFNVGTKYLILNYILITFVYLSIIVITYFLIMLYITFLNSFQKSPDSLFLRIIFSFLPTILATAFGYALERWTKKQAGNQDNHKNSKNGYEHIEDTSSV